MVLQREIQDSEGKMAHIYGVTKDETSVMARLSDNRLILIPIELLQVQSTNRYKLTQTFDELYRTSNQDVVPIIEEVPRIDKKKVDTGVVRAKKTVTETPHIVEQALIKEEIVVERIPKNDVLDEPAQVRVEGDTTIIPVQEEILVVQKKILIREEIHLKKVKTETREKVTVQLKKEEVVIDRKKLT